MRVGTTSGELCGIGASVRRAVRSGNRATSVSGAVLALGSPPAEEAPRIAAGRLIGCPTIPSPASRARSQEQGA